MKSDTDRTGAGRRFSGIDPQPFTEDAKRILRSVMRRRGFTFKQLAAAMEANGESSFESVQTLINKVSRGRFSFAFFLRATRAMGASSIDISPLEGTLPTQPSKAGTAGSPEGGGEA
jgi:hypothetical protein